MLSIFIMLEVDDKAARSHRDEVIIEVLERFDVEILNWQKVDLLPPGHSTSQPKMEWVP